MYRPRPGLTLSLSWGVRINTKLTWKHHVLAKARAYIVLVCLHVETCSPVWAPYQKGAHDDLEKVQKCAARWIRVKWGNYCWSKTNEECQSDLNWATVHQRHLLLTCCKACKIISTVCGLKIIFVQSCARSHRLTLLYKFQS